MMEKIKKDIRGLFKMQDKAMFAQQNIPNLAFVYVGNDYSVVAEPPIPIK